jgi:hypothetical protein
MSSWCMTFSFANWSSSFHICSAWPQSLRWKVERGQVQTMLGRSSVPPQKIVVSYVTDGSRLERNVFDRNVLSLVQFWTKR